MARASLNRTTLESALDEKQLDLTVGSNAHLSVGRHIVIDDEIMLVATMPDFGTTTVTVQRGVMGTVQRSHAAGQAITIGHAPGGEPAFRVLASGDVVLSGDPGGSLPYYRRLGQRARDGQGNEYVMCDFTAVTYSRQPVAITAGFTAAPVGTTGRGAVGIAAEEATPGQWGWVQIYGRSFLQLGMLGVSPSGSGKSPTTLSTSAATIFVLATSQTTPIGIGWTSVAPGTSNFNRAAHIIDGMTVADDASPGAVSAVTSAASHTGSQIAVFLNYPRIRFAEAFVS